MATLTNNTKNMESLFKAKNIEISYDPTNRFMYCNWLGFQNKDSITFPFKVTIPEDYKLFLLQHPEVDVPLKIAFLDREYPIKEIYTGYWLQDIIKNNIHHVTIDPRLMKGTYTVYFVLGSSDGTFTRNSEKVKLEIK